MPRAPLRLLAAAGGSLLWLVADLRGSAQEPRLYTLDSQDPEGGKSTACVWLANDYSFRFIPPPKWSIKAGSTNATLELTEPDLKAAISFRLYAQAEATNAPPGWSVWRARIRERYPKATWLGESACRIADQTGWACDLAIPVVKGTEALVRVVVVPYPGGMAEFEMRTSTVQDSLARRAMRRVLNSLTIDPAAAPRS